VCNADAAWNISNQGSDWTPWSTYDNGAWAAYLPAARNAISGFTFMLENKGAGTCLDAQTSDVGDGGAIIQWTCDGTDHFQEWNGHRPGRRPIAPPRDGGPAPRHGVTAFWFVDDLFLGYERFIGRCTTMSR
jgi:hypothetical protein